MEQKKNPRDRPGARARLAGWFSRWGTSFGCAERPFRRFITAWGADLLLALGAVLISAGAGWVYPPAGLITAGMLLIAGGVLAAKGGDGP